MLGFLVYLNSNVTEFKVMDLYEEIYELLCDKKLNEAVILCTSELKKLPPSGFNIVLELEINHLIEPLIEFLDSNFSNNSKLMVTKAFYTETNGFAINWDKWCLEVFAYDKIENYQSESDWLCESFWGSTNPEYFTITGFEVLQKVYQDFDENDLWKDNELNQASEITEYLFTLKIQMLFKEVLEKGKSLDKPWSKMPWGVTSHGSELILEIK